ncbi:G-box-binding factor-like isoform X1 [Neocloeon triangulifer]|uniref:G-box-binding factor-like isoform X1 n=1 Tax=Neocloeon triangulifer TaxID=2078957 RepID=UPI00286F8FB6|nr:G-box-binding factor-like isoform X1 [Neocloeon triangulifer]
MKRTGVLLLIMGLVGLSSQQGRVAPGVPPQQYNPQHHQHMNNHQQQVPMQHHQQVPVQHQQQVPVQHHQQVPVQHHQQHHQQVPVQQHQQVPVPQVPVQHQVPQQQHQYGQPQVPVHHAAPPQQILNVANMAQEKDHLKEHLHVPVDTSSMSDQELQFHYFKMHDADNNNKLDGSELIKSLIHWHEQGHHHDTPGAPPPPPTEQQQKIFDDQELVNLIDPILSMDDVNRDGYIDYPEFVQAQHKASATPQVKA